MTVRALPSTPAEALPARSAAPQFAPTATALAAELGVGRTRVRIALAAAYARVPRDRRPEPDPEAVASELAARLGLAGDVVVAALARVGAARPSHRPPALAA